MNVVKSGIGCFSVHNYARHSVQEEWYMFVKEVHQLCINELVDFKSSGKHIKNPGMTGVFYVEVDIYCPVVKLPFSMNLI